MMFQVPFLCIAASCLLGHTIAERPSSTEGGVSVRATGGFQTAKRHIPENQVEASSLSETAEVGKSSPSKTAESTVDVQVDKSSLSETAMSALGRQQIIRQQLSIMQQQLDILNLGSAKKDASGMQTPLPGEAGAAPLVDSWKITTNRENFEAPPEDTDDVNVGAAAQKYSVVKTQLTHLKSETPHEVGDHGAYMSAQTFNVADGTLTDTPLKVSDAYEKLREEMQGKEQLIFAKTFDTKAYNTAGSKSHDANEDYKTKLAEYVQKLFMMSRGAHQVTAKEFNEHLKMASDLSKAVHTGYNQIAVGDNSFAKELNTAKGHVSKDGREKMLKYINEVVDAPGGDRVFDRAHDPTAGHGGTLTAEDRQKAAGQQIFESHKSVDVTG